MTKNEAREMYSLDEYLDNLHNEGYFSKPDNSYRSLAEALKGKKGKSSLSRKVFSRLPFAGYHICRSTLEKMLDSDSRALVRTKSTKKLEKIISNYIEDMYDSNAVVRTTKTYVKKLTKSQKKPHLTPKYPRENASSRSYDNEAPVELEPSIYTELNGVGDNGVTIPLPSEDSDSENQEANQKDSYTNEDNPANYTEGDLIKEEAEDSNVKTTARQIARKVPISPGTPTNQTTGGSGPVKKRITRRSTKLKQQVETPRKTPSAVKKLVPKQPTIVKRVRTPTPSARPRPVELPRPMDQTQATKVPTNLGGKGFDNSEGIELPMAWKMQRQIIKQGMAESTAILNDPNVSRKTKRKANRDIQEYQRLLNEITLRALKDVCGDAQETPNAESLNSDSSTGLWQGKISSTEQPAGQYPLDNQEYLNTEVAVAPVSKGPSLDEDLAALSLSDETPRDEIPSNDTPMGESVYNTTSETPRRSSPPGTVPAPVETEPESMSTTDENDPKLDEITDGLDDILDDIGIGYDR